MIARQTAAALGIDPSFVTAEVISTQAVAELTPTRTEAWRDVLTRFPALRLVVTADSAAMGALRQRLLDAGLPGEQIVGRAGTPTRLALTVPDSDETKLRP